MKHVAVVGASGAVGERMIRLLEERRFPLASIKFLASAASAGKSVRFRGEESSDRSSSRPGVLGSRDRAVEHAGERLARVEPDRRGRRRGRRRQLERLPHGPERSPGRPRGQPARHPQPPGNHRQPQLLDDPDGRRAQAAARRRTGPAGRRQHLSIGLGRRQKGIHELESQTEAQVTKAPTARSVQVRASDLRQLHSPDRRLPPERIHQGRDEDGERDPQDHGRPDRSTSARPACGCRCRCRTASRSWSRPNGRSRPSRHARSGPSRRA